MKRIFLVLAVAAVMAMMLVVMAVPASAQSVCEWDYFDEGWFAQYCWSPDTGWRIDDWWKAW
jgi:hypothetical protein